MVLAEAGAAFAVLAATLWLHCRVQPYFHRYQNIAEVVLSLFRMLAIIAACAVYLHRTHLMQVSVEVFGIALVAMLLGPAIIFAVYASVEARRKAKPLLIFHCALPRSRRCSTSDPKPRTSREHTVTTRWPSPAFQSF